METSKCLSEAGSSCLQRMLMFTCQATKTWAGTWRWGDCNRWSGVENKLCSRWSSLRRRSGPNCNVWVLWQRCVWYTLIMSQNGNNQETYLKSLVGLSCVLTKNGSPLSGKRYYMSESGWGIGNPNLWQCLHRNWVFTASSFRFFVGRQISWNRSR